MKRYELSDNWVNWFNIVICSLFFYLIYYSSNFGILCLSRCNFSFLVNFIFTLAEKSIICCKFCPGTSYYLVKIPSPHFLISNKIKWKMHACSRFEGTSYKTLHDTARFRLAFGNADLNANYQILEMEFV